MTTADSHTLNFYPRPPRGGRRSYSGYGNTGCKISIHALREEGDMGVRIFKPYEDISIHALREEGDVVSLKGYLNHSDFYPRPPRGGRHKIYHAMGLDKEISIHALREEGDGLLYDYYTLADLFLSTPSARRAT